MDGLLDLYLRGDILEETLIECEAPLKQKLTNLCKENDLDGQIHKTTLVGEQLLTCRVFSVCI